MNPQDQDQHTSTPEDTLGGAGTLPVAESPSEPQNTTIPAFDEATLQAIDSIEAEPTATVAQAEPAPESSTLGVTNTPPIATVSAPQSPVPPVVTEITPAESTAAGVAAAMGAQSVQTPTQATSPFNSENKPKSRKGLVIVLIIVLALAVGAAGYFVYQSLNSGAATTTETTPFEEETGGSEPGGNDVPVEGTVNP